MDLKEIRETERRAENEKRRQKMIEAAFSCFSRKGMEATSIAEIAAEAAFGEATVYRYFENKETLALECGKWFWARACDFMEAWAKQPAFQGQNGMGKVECVLRGSLAFYRENKEGFRLIHNMDGFLMSHQVEPEQLSAYEEAVDRLRPLLCDAIEEGKRDGSIRESAETEELYYAVTTGMMSVMQKQAAAGNLLSSDGLVDSDRKLEVFLELLIAGFRTACGAEKGRQDG